MVFDRSKVYTSLNADELKIGSKVICAFSISDLKKRVDEGEQITEVHQILNEDVEQRIKVYHGEGYLNYPLVYLVSEPNGCIAYLCRRVSNPEDYYFTGCRSDRWESVKEYYGAKTKLFEGTDDEVTRWCVPRRHLAAVIAAWEDGKTIQYKSGNDWKDCCDNRPSWDVTIEYRIKPEGLKWTDLKIGDIVHRIDTDTSDTNVEAMVVAIDKNPATGFHVMIANGWVADEHLSKDWEKVE